MSMCSAARCFRKSRPFRPGSERSRTRQLGTFPRDCLWSDQFCRAVLMAASRCVSLNGLSKNLRLMFYLSIESNSGVPLKWGGFLGRRASGRSNASGFEVGAAASRKQRFAGNLASAVSSDTKLSPIPSSNCFPSPHLL